MSATTALPDPALAVRELGKLRWRCRRGLLENDLLIERFFARHEHTLTRTQADALMQLMDLSDNDLLDLLLRRKEPEPGSSLDTPGVHNVLTLLRPPVLHP
ncbi:MAG: succinate dehydrogenase assembly factor 2 [Burkholderiaceae bacterium]|jgi:antitoxin CptB|nr:succinate dehydrogenase assembly factor 2 [Burkholderiaceae bacterium]